MHCCDSLVRLFSAYRSLVTIELRLPITGKKKVTTWLQFGYNILLYYNIIYCQTALKATKYILKLPSCLHAICQISMVPYSGLKVCVVSHGIMGDEMQCTIEV